MYIHEIHYEKKKERQHTLMTTQRQLVMLLKKSETKCVTKNF